jgi:hypothetical protein
VDTLVNILFSGGGSFTLAGVLGYALGPEPRRIVDVAVLGLVGTAGVFLWTYVASSESCNECAWVLGRQMSLVFVYVLLPLNVILWLGGTLVGWAVRQARS